MSENKSVQDLINEYKGQIEVWERELLYVKKEIRANPMNNHLLSQKRVTIEDVILDLKFSIALMTNYLE